MLTMSDWTPLMFNAGHGHTDIMIALLRAKANVNAKDEVRVR